MKEHCQVVCLEFVDECEMVAAGTGSGGCAPEVAAFVRGALECIIDIWDLTADNQQ